MKRTFISKTDLAVAYFPHIEARCARAKLMSLIRSSQSLLSFLHTTGYQDRQRLLSPLQVDRIMEEFGNPFK